MEKDFTKYNTAIDLRSLNQNQAIELGELSKNERLSDIFKVSVDFPYLIYSKPCNMVDPDGCMPYKYGCNRHCDGLNLVDYTTFKRVHFSNYKFEDINPYKK